jgi:PAP2 superfamily protein
MAQIAPATPRGQATGVVGGPSGSAIDAVMARLYSAPPIWRELLLLVLFYTAYTLTRLLINTGGTADAFRHAGQILSWERAVGIDVERGLNQALLQTPWLARTANYFYATAHFVVTLGIVIWLYRYRPHHYRWLRAGLVTATAVALVGFWLYPLAPPRFLHAEGFVDPVSALGSWGLYSGQTSGALTNQYAAMPSMHAGWALWCGVILVMLGTQRWVRVAGVIYPTLTVLVIFATANHYILDAVVGIAIVMTTMALSWLCYRYRPLPLRVPASLSPLSRVALGSPATHRENAVIGDARVRSVCKS